MKRLESVMPGMGLREVDAGGLYATLIDTSCMQARVQAVRGAPSGPISSGGSRCGSRATRTMLDFRCRGLII